MRVINTATGQFEEINPKKTEYAILSHTWGEEGEQTYDQLKRIQERYGLGPQNLQSLPEAAEREGITSRSLAGALPAALGRLTEYEVGSMLRLVAWTFGLTLPGPASTNDPSMPLPDPQLHTRPPLSIWSDSELSPKIRDACRIAREKGYDYIWIDSCCIDKSSSAELSEAINSMYKWYSLAKVCYAYLADVPPGKDHHGKDSEFRRSRWFTRGWTLQELIAPGRVEFFSCDWIPIGSKHVLVDLVKSITKIDEKALLHLEPLEAFSVAQRLSWSAKRKTTREEDWAYSLLGIFDINMPTLYGEGNRAFRRLQEQIMEQIPDQSLFAWGFQHENPQFSHNSTITAEGPIIVDADSTLMSLRHNDHPGFLAISPDFFLGCETITTAYQNNIQLQSSRRHKIAYTSTPYGISTQFQMMPLTEDLLHRAIPHIESVQLCLSGSGRVPESSTWYLALLAGCQSGKDQGHRLGRVCYVTPPDSEADVESVLAGFVTISSQNGQLEHPRTWFFLSPQTIEDSQQEIIQKTVHIPHPGSTTQPMSRSLESQQYNIITLVLLQETCDALDSQGYSATLSNLDLDPATQQLKISKNDDEDKCTVTIKFTYSVRDESRGCRINAEVKMSESPNPTPDTISWTDCPPWRTQLESRTVTLHPTGSTILDIHLGLDFAGYGHYFLRVNVSSKELPEEREDSLSVSIGIWSGGGR